MKQIVAFFIVLLPLITTAQVRVASQAKPQKEVVPYDSISNIPADPHGLIGQEVFLFPKMEKLRSHGYICFTKADGGYISPIPHDQVAGHTFKVVDVTDIKKTYSEKTIVKLLDKETGTDYYVEFHDNEFQWPFLTLGYKAKYEAENKGKQFYLLYVPKKDFNTGAEIKAERGSVWTFQEIIAYEDLGSTGYLFNNAQGETVVLSNNTIANSLVSPKTIDQYIKKYGQAMVKTALAGKIKVGMSEELVVLAWGEPDRVNTASYGDQWVYGEINIQCVYFKNGKVTDWN
jgi:hypothetical protein